MFAITGWFGKKDLSDGERAEFLEHIERPMFIELNTAEDYLKIMSGAGTDVQANRA